MKTKTSLLFKEKKRRIFSISCRFDVPSILWQGVYYFPKDIKEYKKNGIIVKGIQAIYKIGSKLYQDTVYLPDEKLSNILNFAKEKQLI